MLSFDEVMKVAMKNTGKCSKKVPKKKSQMSQLPQLTPAPRPNKTQRLVSELRCTPLPYLLPAPAVLNSPLPNKSGAISWADLVAEERSSVSELQKTIKMHEATIDKLKEFVAEQKKHLDRFGALLSAADKRAHELEAKTVQLQNAKLVAAKKAKQEKYRFQKQLQVLRADKKKDFDQFAAKLVAETERAQNFEAENVLLQTELVNFRSQQQLSPAKRCKQLHKCQNCEYTTTKSYAMKVHREEGCKSAKVVKTLKCEICHRDVTHNTYRYHLNQYTKQSSQAKNGHENFTPAQHIEMLAKLSKTKR